MSVRPIVLLGDPRLRLKGRPVDSFGKYLHGLLDDLTETMRKAPGVGLAAPQIGEAVSACVVEADGQLYELVNPRIVRADGEDRDLEGCLSVPGYVAYITRKEKVWIVAQNRQGRKIKAAGSGLLGRAFQHEIDHLDGKLYIDYLDSMDELISVEPGEEDGARPRTRRSGARVSKAAADPSSAVQTVFFGSGSFAVPILDALFALPGISVAGVVSAPDRPAGRKAVLTPTPVAARARELGLPLLQPARVRRPEGVEAVRTLAPDLAVLADYGQLIPRELLELPPRGFLNLHPSALPRHRGAAPIPATILAGDRVVGREPDGRHRGDGRGA